MSNANIREFADQLSDVFVRMEDCKVEAQAIIDAAKEAGVNTKALRKVARELVMQSDKLAKRYADEEQLDMFRAQVGVFERKGLATTDKASSAHKVISEKKFRKAVKEFDQVLGSNHSEDYDRMRVAIHREDIK